MEALLKRHQMFRQDRDSDIEDENKSIDFMRRIIEVAEETERDKRPIPEVLTPEEQNLAIKHGMESKLRKLASEYWNRIGELTLEGHTQEEAREKIYSDLISQGDVKGAKLIREFQNKIHPLQTKDPDKTTPSSQQIDKT